MEPHSNANKLRRTPLPHRYIGTARPCEPLYIYISHPDQSAQERRAMPKQKARPQTATPVTAADCWDEEADAGRQLFPSLPLFLPLADAADIGDESNGATDGGCTDSMFTELGSLGPGVAAIDLMEDYLDAAFPISSCIDAELFEDDEPAHGFPGAAMWPGADLGWPPVSIKTEHRDGSDSRAGAGAKAEPSREGHASDAEDAIRRRCATRATQGQRRAGRKGTVKVERRGTKRLGRRKPGKTVRRATTPEERAVLETHFLERRHAGAGLEDAVLEVADMIGWDVRRVRRWITTHKYTRQLRSAQEGCKRVGPARRARRRTAVKAETEPRDDAETDVKTETGGDGEIAEAFTGVARGVTKSSGRGLRGRDRGLWDGAGAGAGAGKGRGQARTKAEAAEPRERERVKISLSDMRVIAPTGTDTLPVRSPRSWANVRWLDSPSEMLSCGGWSWVLTDCKAPDMASLMDGDGTGYSGLPRPSDAPEWPGHHLLPPPPSRLPIVSPSLPFTPLAFRCT